MRQTEARGISKWAVSLESNLEIVSDKEKWNALWIVILKNISIRMVMIAGISGKEKAVHIVCLCSGCYNKIS